MGADTSFNLSDVFATVARTIPDHTFLVWRDRRLTYAEADARIDGLARYLTSVGLGCHTERDAARRPRIRSGSPRDLPAQRQRVPRGDDGQLPRQGGSVQRQLPLRLRRARLPAHRLERAGPGVPRRVRPARGRDPRPPSSPPSPDSGGRRLRQRTAARGRRLRDHPGHAGAVGWTAHAVGRRSVHPVHRRHHRNAEGRALAPARHLPVFDGRAPMGRRARSPPPTPSSRRRRARLPVPCRSW